VSFIVAYGRRDTEVTGDARSGKPGALITRSHLKSDQILPSLGPYDAGSCLALRNHPVRVWSLPTLGGLNSRVPSAIRSRRVCGKASARTYHLYVQQSWRRGAAQCLACGSGCLPRFDMPQSFLLMVVSESRKSELPLSKRILVGRGWGGVGEGGWGWGVGVT